MLGAGEPLGAIVGGLRVVGCLADEEPGAAGVATDVASGELTFKNTPAMIDLFEQITGVDYPWAKYSQIVVRDFVFCGMENTSATTMTENILFDRKAARDFTSDPLISHELAHQWFGDLMTCRDWSHGWLNESFATYLEMLWDEHHLGIDHYRQGAIENAELYFGERYRRPIVTNVFNQPIDLFDRHLYEKGSVVLAMLRSLLGDDQFFRSIQRYIRENQERSVITQDLAAAIEAETGRNLDWFFDQWVYRPGHPNFKVSWSYNDDHKLATVTVKQTQPTTDGTPIFRMPVTIDFRKGRTKPQSFRVEITEAEHTFVFPVSQKPDLCRFDPYGGVLKEVDFEKSVGELRLQLRDDDDITRETLVLEIAGFSLFDCFCKLEVVPFFAFFAFLLTPFPVVFIGRVPGATPDAPHRLKYYFTRRAMLRLFEKHKDVFPRVEIVRSRFKRRYLLIAHRV